MHSKKESVGMLPNLTLDEATEGGPQMELG